MAADEMAQALRAFQNQQYTVAQQMWEYLANRGDATAQYNLSIMFEKGIGVTADSDKATRMQRLASRAGLVDAYNHLQSDTIKSASREDAIQAMLVIDPQAWVKTQDPRHYTLQLASSRSRKLIEKYFNENQLQGKAGFYKSRRQGELWFALVYGAYPSVSEANAAIAELPKDLRKWSPWVRRIESIHKITVK